MHNYRSYILNIGCFVAVALTGVSCGSKRAVTRDTRIPRVTGEISLDEFVGKGSNGETVIVSEVISTKEAEALVKAARRWLGTPYKYGGDTRRGVDCSAMVMNVYNEALNLKIPRTTRTQREYAMHVSRHDLQPGDLVFFSPGIKGKNISHVGLFIGSDRFIHASSSRGVVVSSLDERYYRDHYHSGGRILKKQTLIKNSMVDSRKSKESTPEQLEMLDRLMEQRLEQLDEILTATIDSIYSMPVDDDPNLAPGL